MKLSKLGQKLSDAGIEIVFNALPEDIKISDFFEEQKYIDSITEKYENGNDEAWFCASVKLEFDGIESDTEYLGACSYESFDQFTGTDNDYFDGMLLTCYNSLKETFAVPRLELPLITF